VEFYFLVFFPVAFFILAGFFFADTGVDFFFLPPPNALDQFSAYFWVAPDLKIVIARLASS
jgi:hypothetical protein